MEPRILRRREVERLTSLSKSTLYRLARGHSSFPSPIQLGPLCSGLAQGRDRRMARHSRAGRQPYGGAEGKGRRIEGTGVSRPRTGVSGLRTFWSICDGQGRLDSLASGEVCRRPGAPIWSASSLRRAASSGARASDRDRPDFKPPAYRKRDTWPKTSMHLIGAQVATHQDQKRADIPCRPASPRSPQRRPGSETRGSRIHTSQQVDP